MKKKISIILNILIVIFEVIALIMTISSDRRIYIEYFTVDSNMLALFSSIVYLVFVFYKNKIPKVIPKPAPTENLSAFLDDWDYEYITKIDLDSTFDLMNAASDLQIQSLLDLASIKIASILKNRGIEDIRTMFDGECDLSEKELKEYAELQNL